MIVKSYGDLAHHLMMRSRNAELKMDVARLSEELATGKHSNLTEKLGGDFTYLADIENTLSRLESYQVANGEVKLFAMSMQSNLERVQSNTQDLRDSILGMTPAMTAQNAEQFASDARLELENSISSLNSWAGGRSLFAGTATSTTPLNGSDVLMTELVSEVAGLTDADDIILAVKDWFDDPAGFDAAMYNGSTTNLSPVDVGDGEQVALTLRADDPDLKTALQSFAIAALVDEGALALSDGTKVDLIRAAGMELASSNERLISLQADIGFTEGQLERATSRNEAAKTSLSIAKNDLVTADPFETYTRLEEAQLQLQSLYTVTARSSELSLLRFM